MITVTAGGVSQVLGYEHIMTQNSLAHDYLVICYAVGINLFLCHTCAQSFHFAFEVQSCGIHQPDLIVLDIWAELD